MKEYRKLTGKFSWLAQGTQPDLSYTVLTMFKKTNFAMIADLHIVNKVLRKGKAKESEMYYGRVGENEEKQIVGIGDTSFKQDE